MPRSWTDEAVVLRTYNVGETDRYCILLTKSHGRLAARANGVRRLVSRRGGGLLPLHKVSVTCETHSFGMTISAASCIDSHSQSWSDPHIFSSAERGVELLLALTDDGENLEPIYHLTCEFLSACCSPQAPHLADLFTVKLLMTLGTYPSMEYSAITDRPLAGSVSIVFSPRSGGFALYSEDSSGRILSASCISFLRLFDTLSLAELALHSPHLHAEIAQFVRSLLGSQLGSSLSAPGVSDRIASGVTPTCMVSGRA